jgi:PAS domain S-box-containing protein
MAAGEQVVNLPAILRERDLAWDGAIIGTAAAALILNLIGLLNGITVAIPHLLYIPVVIAAYRYPRRGALIAGCIGGMYFLMVVLIAGTSQATVVEALVRTLVVVVIGWLIAALTRRLREQEDLYKGLFDHSESGNVLVRDSGQGRLIENANWIAAKLVGREPAGLTGSPLTAFWNADAEQEFFSRLARDGVVYEAETTFFSPNGDERNVLVSAALLPEGRSILTCTDITGRIHAERALKTANDKLNLLSRISTDHIHRTVDRIIVSVDEAIAQGPGAGIRGYFERIRTFAQNIASQLLLTQSYKDLGTSPPVWLGVQQLLNSARLPAETDSVSVRFWTERLAIYADPLFSHVLTHLVENSIRHGGSVKNVVVTYHETADGLDLIVEDDGFGIPAEKKQEIFEYDERQHAGIGLFICRQIVEVTDMTIRETGTGGRGARFVIHIPHGGYRIEGTSDDAPPFPLAEAPGQPGHRGARHSTGTAVRELVSAEFPVAHALWVDYHQTRGDIRTDRIFAAFLNGQAVSIARHRQHPDGFEVDGVFTPVSQRGHGYANAVMWGLVEACGHHTLYMHSVKNLTGFYSHYGFVPIDEKELPPTIMERFAWAQGEMEGANVAPMRRDPPPV